jgi:hypothetical protein
MYRYLEPVTKLDKSLYYLDVPNRSDIRWVTGDGLSNRITGKNLITKHLSHPIIQLCSFNIINPFKYITCNDDGTYYSLYWYENKLRCMGKF